MLRLPLNLPVLAGAFLCATLGLGIADAPSALAKFCGPRLGIPCACGDTLELVTRETVITSPSDPVCSAPCPGIGLQVTDKGGTTILHLDHCTITGGPNSTIGIEVFDSTVLPIRELRILNGTIKGFDVAAIRMRGTRNASSGFNAVSGFRILEGNGDGIVIEGNDTRVADNNVSKRRVGIHITGSRNFIVDNSSSENRDVGILVRTTAGQDKSHQTTLDHNSSMNNTRGDGIRVEGNFNTLENRNYAKGNGGKGIVVIGNNNTLETNTATDNKGGDGISVNGNNNLLDHNYGEDNNAGSGVAVVAGTNNILIRNTGRRNGRMDKNHFGFGVFAPLGNSSGGKVDGDVFPPDTNYGTANGDGSPFFECNINGRFGDRC